MGYLQYILLVSVIVGMGSASILTEEEKRLIAKSIVELRNEFIEEEKKTQQPEGYGPICVSRRYKIFLNELVWSEAAEACINDGGRLAVIRDQETAMFIKEYLQTSGIKARITTGIWIGLNDLDEEGTLITPEGIPFDLHRCGTYQDWANNQPDNNLKRGPDGQDCVQLWSKDNFSWDDDYCNFRPKAYMCEYDVCKPECAMCNNLD